MSDKLKDIIEFKDEILRMTAQSPYSTMHCRKLYQAFGEAQTKEIASAVRELAQEKKIYVAGVPHGFEVFSCILIKK